MATKKHNTLIPTFSRGNIMRKKYSLILIFIIIFLLISYNSYNDKPRYSSPTMTQVNAFISENSINALSIKEANDFTVVLYQNPNSYGHYVLYKDQKSKLYSHEVNASGVSKDNKVLPGGVASGSIPFITVIINDEDMLQKAKEIKVTFTDGTVKTEEIYDKGIIILHDNKMNKESVYYSELTIYDKDMKKIYEPEWNVKGLFRENEEK